MRAFAGAKAIGVNPTCENMDVAVALAAYLGGEEAQKAHFLMRDVIPANITLGNDEEVKANPVAIAQAATIDNTAIMQPFVAKMGNYWGPAENMGKAIVAKEVTHDNAADETAKMNDTMNKEIVE